MDGFQIVALIFAIALSLLIIGNVVHFVLYVFFSSLNFTFEKAWFSFNKRVPRKLQEKYEPVLISRFAYYRKLSEPSRQKFLFRLGRFIKSKTFTGRKGLEVTDEKKILISASAIQLTFGLDYYMMDRFSEIVIYPDIFPARGGENYHRGETNMRGVIAFSWKHFYEGYAIEDDKYNLGLHEMAHALEISGLVDGLDKYFNVNYEKWSHVARAEYENVRDGRASILREYAGTNVHEFFAACVEHFFEASAEFKERLPELYRWLALTLRQDPLLTIEKYAENVQHISNAMPLGQWPAVAEFQTRFHVGGLISQIFFLGIAWIFTIIVSSQVPGTWVLVISGILYGGILLMRISYTYTVFELYGKHIMLRRPMHFNDRYCVAYDNIIRVEFTSERDLDMVRIFYIDHGNLRSLEKYFSVSEEEIGELRRRLIAKKVLIKD